VVVMRSGLIVDEVATRGVDPTELGERYRDLVGVSRN
jgi:hypothetical protein